MGGGGIGSERRKKKEKEKKRKKKYSTFVGEMREVTMYSGMSKLGVAYYQRGQGQA